MIIKYDIVSLGSVLDLGCGTGLVGLELKSFLKNIDGVDSVLSLLDAPIFFQPKVGLTDVADNLKDITFEDIDLDLAKDEIINNPIYKELIISKDGKVTAMQVVLKGNNEYNNQKT